MKKSKLKKILASSAMGIMALAMPFTLTGCDKNDNTLNPQNFRVQDGWVQYTNDGEEWINLCQSEQSEVELKTYTITYEYGEAKDLLWQGDYQPQTGVVEENSWLKKLPKCYHEGFIGWFIEGTDKQITEYDYIAGDITLEARFDFKLGPAGAYKNGKYVKTWQQMIDDNDIVVKNGGVLSKKYSSFTSFSYDELNIDNSITEIEEGAITNGLLKGIKFSDNLRIIGDRAFAHFRELTHLDLGDRVEVVGERSFLNCENLESVLISTRLFKIGYGAFMYCDKLNNIIFNSSTENYSWRVYSGGECLYDNALYLTDSHIISLLKFGVMLHKSYEDDVFYCGENEGENYKTGETSWLSTKIISVKDKTITSLDIKGSSLSGGKVTEIESFAFNGCENITSVIIPESVISIGRYAFNLCTSLESITFEAREGYKWQVYENDAWRDAEDSELFDLVAKEYKELRRVAE